MNHRPISARRSVLRWLPALLVCMAVPTGRSLAAAPRAEEVRVVGGTSALARTLGLDPVPERARFITELVHVVYEAAEGKGAARDRRSVQLSAYVQAVERLDTALREAQPSDAGLTLAVANRKPERRRLEAVFGLMGLKLASRNRTFTVVPEQSEAGGERRSLMTFLGIDVAGLATRVNKGESVRVRLETDTVPLPLPAPVWSTGILHRTVSADALFGAVVQDRSAALLCHGLAALDDDTLQYLSERPGLLRALYDEHAPAFAAFAGSLRIRQNAVVVPGGPAAAAVWEGVLDAPVSNVERFTRALFSRREGRLAYLYDALAQFDAGRRAFALGLWMDDPGLRRERFAAMLDAADVLPGWGVAERPFSRPPDDLVMLLARMRVDDRGVPAASPWRRFWAAAFDGTDIPSDPAKLVSGLEKDGAVDGAWFAQALVNTPTQHRAERLDQLSFGQRAFAAVGPSALPDALVAVRAFPRFRMLVLTLERMGITTPAVYAGAVRHADRLSSLDPQRLGVALSQFQGALALLDRAARVGRLQPQALEPLIASLSQVPLGGDGYAGGVARWLRTVLMPRLQADPALDIDAVLLRAAAGQVPRADDPAPSPQVSWEDREYRLDLVQPEVRRITRALQRVRAQPIQRVLELEGIATSLSRPTLTLADVRTAQASLSALTSARPSKGDALGRAVRDLSAVASKEDLSAVKGIVRTLLEQADDLLAESLRGWAYAVDLGEASAGRLITGDVSSRHDFGFTDIEGERRARLPWSEPIPVVQPAVPWHLAGSLLGLDLGLSGTLLRRVAVDGPPQPPRLLAADRDVFVKTVALLRPSSVDEAATRATVDAVAAGRTRAAQLVEHRDGFEALADAIGMDGWRRRALQWTLAHDPSRVASYFSLAELRELGSPTGARGGASGVSAVALDGCLCVALPATRQWSVLAGRPGSTATSSHVADLTLRVEIALAELRLPFALAKGVLTAAAQDYVDAVRPLYPDDWLALTRSAQSITKDRIADYVAGLTADGTLAPLPDVEGRR